VWIYEFPCAAHDRAAGEVIAELKAQMGQHFRDVVSAASPRCDNNAANWSYEPDGSLTVFDWRPGQGHADAADSAGNRWPNIIVEVAYRESEAHVHANTIDWLDTATDPNNCVQQVFRLVTPRHSLCTAGSTGMVAVGMVAVGMFDKCSPP
jgi:hypothetical protein